MVIDLNTKKKLLVSHLTSRHTQHEFFSSTLNLAIFSAKWLMDNFEPHKYLTENKLITISINRLK